MSPLDAAITGASSNTPLTDPKKAEAENEELDLEELKDAAGGLEGGSGNDLYLRRPKRTVQDVSGASGPGGTTYLKENIGGASGPGGTSF